MCQQSKPVLLFLSLLLALTVPACSTPAPTPTPAPTATPAPTSTPTVALAAEQRLEEAGFAYRPIPGYVINGIDISFFMTEPNAKVSIGPTFLFIGGPTETEQTLDEALDDFAFQVSDVEFSNRKEFTLDGAPALSARVNVSTAEQQVVGRVVVAHPNVGQEFFMLGFAPLKRWETEIEVLFEAVLASIRFFEPSNRP